MRLVDVRLGVKHLRQVPVMVVGVVLGIGDKYCVQRSQRARVPIADGFEVFDVRGDLAAMPRSQNLRHILEVLVEGGAAYAGLLSNAGHGDAVETLCRRDAGRLVHDRVGHRRAVRFNAVVPKLGHVGTMPRPCRRVETNCLDNDTECLDKSQRQLKEERMARAATGMPQWVKVFIGVGVLAIVVVGVLIAMGHGPWQHGAMGGMHG